MAKSKGGRALRSLLIAVTGLALVTASGWWLLNTAQQRGLIGPAPVPAHYRELVIDAAARCPAIPRAVFFAQMELESGWDPNAASGAGARGIAQFMPEVWQAYGIDANKDGKTNVWDPADALASAAELNCRNRRLVKDVSGNRLENTLAAYNAGYGAVAKYDGVPPFPETINYVKRILENAKSITW
ncbi:MAG: lytic transglycosylase domain-containing protein [Candidatus Nanopelagicales bacterium]|nr:lytic transglycosylase domain-containing protein [Candidatus Nanopelagicales bacterium]